MGRVTGSWERPVQGVSQQSDKDRIDGQCTLQENLIPSPLDGLIKRIGTRNIGKLKETVHPDSIWYSYNRGDDESYLIVIEPMSKPRVFDITGNERIVNVQGGLSSYYEVANPKEDLRMSTIADFTFLLNTTVDVKVGDELSATNPNTAIVYCQFATYGRDYIVLIDGVEVAKYVTPDGSETEHINDVKTNVVAEEIAAQLNGSILVQESALAATEYGTSFYVDVLETPRIIYSLYNITQDEQLIMNDSNLDTRIFFERGNTIQGDTIRVNYSYDIVTATGLTAEVHGNTVFVSKIDGTSFSIDTVDSADGNDLVAVQDTVKQTSNLPPYAPDGFVVKVRNAEGFEQNAYWLRAEPDDEEGTDNTGSNIRWVESLAQGVKYKIDENTMPYTLVSESDGSFTLDVGTWEDKRVGNEDTNPFPSFVDSTVNSIGTFQNRMLFTSGEAAVFGRTNFFFDFFRETTQTESDSDPIDAFADTSEINNLVHHAVLDGDIIFFAENGQFLIKGSEPITKANLIFKKITSYPLNTVAKPATTGESILFSYVSGKYSGIREMFTDSFTDTKRARPITEHVSEYIEGNVVDLVSSPNINTLIIRTDTSSGTLYVYDWLWSGDQKIQAAMHKWIFDGVVLFSKFIQDKLFIVLERADGVYLEQIPIGNDTDDNGLDFAVRLDRRTTTTASWVNDRWEFTLPYEPNQDKLVFVRGDGCWDDDKGTSVIYETDGIKYWSYDDLAEGTDDCTLTAGTTFTSRYIPTKPYLKDGNGRAMGLDRFTIGKVWLNYESLGDTDIKVSDSASKRDWSYNFNGRMMGSFNNRIGFAPLDSGRYQFPVRLPANRAQFEIITDDYIPFVLRDMEWEGLFKQRGKRL